VRVSRQTKQPVNDFLLGHEGGAGTAPIPLLYAVLCIDCDIIYGSLSGPCPCCGGMSRLPLQTILHSMACGS
jgi:hypothetical protein